MPTPIIHNASLHIQTVQRGFVDITTQVRTVVTDSGARAGLCTVFVHHTSASVVVQENQDSDVRRDLEAYFARLVVDGDPLFAHVAEGPDDMSSHVRAALTATSVGIPIARGNLDLGTWQAVYLWEHRMRPHNRRISVVVVGSR